MMGPLSSLINGSAKTLPLLVLLTTLHTVLCLHAGLLDFGHIPYF